MRLVLILALACTAPVAAQCPTPDPHVPVGTSRLNPAPVGVAATVSFGDYSASLTLLETRDCLTLTPPEGMRYLCARVSFALTCAPDLPWNLHPDQFAAFSDFAQMPYANEAPPVPALYGDVFQNGTMAGWLVLLVPEDDACPLLTFGRNSNGSGGAWLKLGSAKQAGVHLGWLGVAGVMLASLGAQSRQRQGAGIRRRLLVWLGG